MTKSRQGEPARRARVGELKRGLCLLTLSAASCAGWAAEPAADAGQAAEPAIAPAAPASVAGAPQTQLKQVDVTGRAAGGNQTPPAYAGGQIATGGRVGVLGEQNAADVPFSVISFTSQLIDNQQSQTVGDVLLNDAAVQTAFGFGNFAEVFQIRGFTLTGEDVSFGGLYGVLPRQIVQASFIDRVELFKGANAFTKGVSPTGSGVGGAVNLEPKRATAKPINRASLGYLSDSRIQEAIDIGRRYGDSNQYGARVNVQHTKGDTAIDGENASDISVGVGLDYSGDRARSSLDFGYQKTQYKHGRNTVNTGTATRIPTAPDASTNYAPSFSSTELESIFGKVGGEYDLTDAWTAYADVGGNTTDEQGQYGSPTLVGNDGAATVTQLGVPYEAHSFAGQAGVRGDINTGPVTHKLNLGYSGFYRKTSSAFTFGLPGAPTNIYDPPSVGPIPTTLMNGDLDNPNVRSRTRAGGWALSDTAGLFDDRLLLTVGGRYQSLSVQNYNYDGSEDGSAITGHEITPIYGVVFKPTQWSSLYYNHIEALQPGDSAPTLAPDGLPVANGGAVIGVAESKQDEVGAKLDFGKIGGSLALYQIERPEAYTDPATRIFGYNGEQRSRGVELNIYGEPVDGLRLLGSATVIDPELRNTLDRANDGNDARGVPDYRVVLGGDWDLPGAKRWTANARVIRTGSQYADQANQLKLDPWTRVDLGLRYDMPLQGEDKKITWRANVENVADSDYWASAQGGYLSQGDPRTFKLSATWDF